MSPRHLCSSRVLTPVWHIFRQMAPKGFSKLRFWLRRTFGRSSFSVRPSVRPPDWLCNELPACAASACLSLPQPSVRLFKLVATSTFSLASALSLSLSAPRPVHTHTDTRTHTCDACQPVSLPA